MELENPFSVTRKSLMGFFSLESRLALTLFLLFSGYVDVEAGRVCSLLQVTGDRLPRRCQAVASLPSWPPGPPDV